mmetsp:Transcript_123255/g.343146  ORF Transcript_123255/g.343146 Transcript_123255/m.343146 type:complete len:440 (+) Transcript_123255:148-1467(+)
MRELSCCCLQGIGLRGKFGDTNRIVVLNVGGEYFTTSFATLKKCPKLADVISRPPGPDGSYFVDRDGHCFGEVLNFLRDGPQQYHAPSEAEIRRMLEREAKYLGLPELASCLQKAALEEQAPLRQPEPPRSPSKQNQALRARDKGKVPFSDVRLVKFVGQGSFGKAGFGLWMGTPVCIKMIESKASIPGETTLVKPATWGSFLHPNLVQQYKFLTRAKPAEAGVEEEPKDAIELWSIEEWCNGGTLRAFCRRPRVDSASILEVILICRDITAAGRYLHNKGVIHGDLTANNVLLKKQVHMEADSRGYICKVGDHGLAHMFEGANSDFMTSQLRTITHLPPELLESEKEVRFTKQADVYATGVILWQVLRGEVPYEGHTVPQIVVMVMQGIGLELPQNTPKELNKVFGDCTAAVPDHRPTFLCLDDTLGALKKHRMRAPH